LDLSVLFEPKQLRVVADKIKEDAAVSPLQQHHTALIRWLEERRTRGAVCLNNYDDYNIKSMMCIVFFGNLIHFCE